MADMGTKEATEKWSVSQKRVAAWCRRTKDPKVTQDKKGSPWHIPKNYPNPFKLQQRYTEQNAVSIIMLAAFSFLLETAENCELVGM